MEFVEGQIMVRGERISAGCGRALQVIFQGEVVLMERISARRRGLAVIRAASVETRSIPSEVLFKW
jgi:hypothetical protein